MQLHTKQWPSQGPEIASIVLLHGIGGTGLLWRPIALNLENHFLVTVIDQRGHGKSRGLPDDSGNHGPECFGPEIFGNDVAETLRHLFPNSHQKHFIVGHSMGVRTALGLYHCAPELVAGLLLIDIGFSGPAGGGMGEALEKFLSELPLEFADRASARTIIHSHAPDPSMAQYVLATLEEVQDPGSNQKRFVLPLDRTILLKALAAAKVSNVGHWLGDAGRSKLPVLILRGAKSRVWDKQDYETEKSRFKQYPSILFEEISGAGHGLPFEVRETFTQRATDWIREQVR